MKKKLIAILLVVCVAAITVSTASLAYFTDKQVVENTFAVGNVTIKLDEAMVEIDGNGHAVLVPDQRTSANQSYGNLYPGFGIKKDPTITNTGTESAYVGAKVMINPQKEISDKTVFENLISGGLLDDSTKATVKKAWNGSVYEIYIVCNAALSTNETAKLFDTLAVNTAYTNEQMKELASMKITVEAYAVQSVGMTGTALDALKTAFDHIS
jgi:predicted ribosomally synthesized peptide with SipW-like signal peptide